MIRKLMKMKEALVLALVAIFAFSSMAYAGTPKVGLVDKAVALPGGFTPGPLVGGITSGVTFARELFGACATAVVIPEGANNYFGMVYTMNTAVTTSGFFFIEFNLKNGAKWGETLADTSLVYEPVAGGTVKVSKTQGGQTWESFAKYIITPADNNTDKGDKYTLIFKVQNATALATPGTKLPIEIKLYTDAGNQLDSTETPWYATSAYGANLEVKKDPTRDDFKIDVMQGSKFFTAPPESVSSTHVILGLLNLSNDSAKEDDGKTDFRLGLGDANGTTKGELVITGAFNAAKKAPGMLYLGVDANGDGIYEFKKEGFTVDTTVTPHKATLALSVTDLQYLTDKTKTPAGSCKIGMIVDGVTEIDQMKAEDHFPHAVFTLNYGNVCYIDHVVESDLNPVEKNGSFARKTFLLSPSQAGGAGPLRNFVRITNPSTTDGSVFFTVINDVGDSCMFNLKDVQDIYDAPAVVEKLKAKASTQFISVDKIYTVAEKKCTFSIKPYSDASALPKPSKLRLDVNAEFGVTGDWSGVVVDAISPSTDGTGFTLWGKQ
ncbi:MAG: hypothetical protein BWK80_54825 [Desulfobacteraceae bacterium IS3]|nr:MAG: hypothetical protein BWK80_54825 [Desulfobacteraceae bacterium IS3]